ncbi:molecular chaperone DnaJ [Clostridium saccharobutylicum]|uniref:DnaJ-class molecular chaperone n=2 Tax=Clostridium saccharobutylicum TaxID=169679 RepID=U5MTX4_CLOSA|nr:molecular chaperone DnaJ [Clostridium saccharobutylicum]AGX43116.1 DnaJ-class molecular chaperone [Clostridium saccharobutylicum DSM 13864]AQR90413.1 hypothetical protein CLOSC_21300 [Clostridium saccharobutylicum]AQS00319.1 hypothetical protein CSACC_21370 [Clostridium saccharobutylicum]AQS14302.1 hypothetical protein CLOSACC_21370 [Clostridium saccharobutylicum]MBA2907017.1 hypothetical protein [Clostridium saccharobutylicum]
MEIKLVLLDINNGKFEIYKEINEYCENNLCITQYEKNKRNNNFLHLGVKLIDVYNPKDYIVSIGNENYNNLKFNNDVECFYQETIGEDADQIGISKAGFFKVEIRNSERKIVYTSEQILVKPSIISVEMYKQMVDMLLNINKDLVMQDFSNIYLNIEGKKEDLSETVLNFLNNIENLIYNINKNPYVELVKEDAKVSYKKIKKISSKVIIEKELYPFKNKFMSEVARESKDTYENRMICSALLDIKNLIETNLNMNLNYINKINKDIKITTAQINSMCNTPIATQKMSASNAEERAILNLGRNNSSDRLPLPMRPHGNLEYFNDLERKLERLNNTIKLLKDCKANWTSSNNKIDAYLKLEIFKELKMTQKRREKWRTTQVFLHDLTYGKLYRKLKNFCEDSNYNLSDLEEEQLNIKEVYDVFEIWLFFYMAKILIQEQGWKIEDNRNIIKNVNKYLIKNKTLYGFSIEFIHKLAHRQVNTIEENRVNMKLVYNKTIKLETGNLRPDFTFIFNCRNVEKRFYLDAKYHNYTNNKHAFLDDIKNVAIEKYYLKLLNTEDRAVGSFIVHCNNNFENFGGKASKKNINTSPMHRCGSFSLIPDNSINFITWISLIMEWFYDEYNVCWNCGNTKPEEKQLSTFGGKIKYHYTCYDCGSFWVKNHCGTCDCNKIIKHDLPQKQYHIQTNEKWMMECPKCGESGGTKPKITYMEKRVEEKCPRCHGRGRIPQYKHTERGRCFLCDGAGYIYS